MDVKAESQSLVESLAGEVATALGGAATPAARGAMPAASAAGWLASTTVTGGPQGGVTLWFEHEGLVRAMTAALTLDAPPAPDAVTEFLTDTINRATGVLAERSASAGSMFSPPQIVSAAAPQGGTAFDVAIDGQAPFTVVLSGAWPDAASASSVNDRLQAVLDVDLPLVVRFGGTVVPLRTLATLASGSMVDMNRAPDDPVDLLVGDRVIAKGEVVVVAGHYGVRIISLTNQHRPAAGMAGV